MAGSWEMRKCSWPLEPGPSIGCGSHPLYSSGQSTWQGQPCFRGGDVDVISGWRSCNVSVQKAHTQRGLEYLCHFSVNLPHQTPCLYWACPQPSKFRTDTAPQAFACPLKTESIHTFLAQIPPTVPGLPGHSTWPS